MRRFSTTTLFFLLGSSCVLVAQDGPDIEAVDSEIAEGLDLKAVSEVFRDAKNLEEFEKSLNDPETGIRQ